MNKQLELEAEDYLLGKRQGNVPTSFEDVKNIFIAEATSNAAKEYWYEQFEKQKLEFAIEQFKLFDCAKDKIKELQKQLSEL